MNPSREEALFELALSKSAAKRAAWLDAECEGDAALCQHLEALRDFRDKEDPAELDSRELAELLLPAVAGTHQRVTSKDFDRLRKRAQRKPNHS